MKKKILSVLLTFALGISMIQPAFAEEAVNNYRQGNATYAETNEQGDTEMENNTSNSAYVESSENDSSTDNTTATNIEETNEESSQAEGDDSAVSDSDSANSGSLTEEGASNDSGTDEEESFEDVDVSGLNVGGYLENDFEEEAPVSEDGSDLYRASSLPASYQTDIAALRSRYPQARAQGSYGTCWTFSSLGLMEFNLVKNGLADKTIDLSELQLSYFTYNFQTDPLGGTSGDTASYSGSPNYLMRGGTYSYAARRLAQWVGAASETDVPYSNAASTLTSGLNSSYAYSKDAAHLKSYYTINIKKQANAVKSAVRDYGAAGIMIYLNENLIKKSTAANACTYYDTESNTNKSNGHTVVIVGWDDNFSNTNFPESNRPSSNGAWLVRNSWGAGNTDYFWISYETYSIQSNAWVFEATVKGQEDYYDNNYQLDGGLGTVCSEDTTVANVFTTQKKTGIASEKLKAVSLSMTKAANVTYKIQIYTNLKDSKNPTSGTLQKNATTEGTTDYAGMYTIPLNTEVTLSPGTIFAVVVTVDKKALDQEYTTVDNGSGNWVQAVSQANGKSLYQSGSSTFAVTSGGNYCIKAYTSNISGSSKDADTSEKNPSVQYKTHVQTYGWQSWVLDGAMSGTSGQAKRLEGIEIKLKDATYSGSICYTTHVQTYGWQNDIDDESTWSKDGAMSGTSGQAKRLEAIKIKLTGEMAEHYDVYYRVHAQTYGWLGWAKNGASAGTSGYSKRLEAIQIVLVKKGSSAPGTTYQGVTSTETKAMYSKALAVNYTTHVQTYGWQGTVSNGAMSGTSGLAKRLEGIKISLANVDHSGGISYITHVQTYGWQGNVNDESTWKKDGEMAGTSGQSKRLEAICIKLTGNMAKYYDVYYRVHIQTYGWLSWAKNGGASGSEGLAKRLEGIQIVLVKKGSSAPGKTYQGVTSTDSRTYIY